MIREATIFSEWLAQSRAAGKLEGKNGMMLQVLEKKFGRLRRELEATLNRLNSDQFDDLAVDIFDLKDLDSLRLWLNTATTRLADA
ncbi:MAG: DUF4351 domain-containing protein [candidate division KSB1 bacterium]